MEPKPLFPTENLVEPRPLFPETGSGGERELLRPVQPSAPSPVPPLFSSENIAPLLPLTPSHPEPAPADAQPLFQPAPMAPLPKPQLQVVQPTVAFQEEMDPLAEKVWQSLVQQFPSASESSKIHWRAKLRTLFPLTAESLNSVGQSAAERMPMVMNEVSRLGRLLADLEPAAVLGRITEQARAAHQAASGLRAKFEALLHTFHPEEAHQTLLQMQAQLTALRKGVGPVRDLVSDLSVTLDEDLPLVSSVAALAQTSSLGALATRRQEMMQALHQQLAMALMQLDQIAKQIAESLQSLDELRTVTLPALGFLQSLR